MTHHILIRLLHFLQRKHFVIHHGLNAAGIDRLVHLLKLQPTPHQYPPDCTDVVQALQETRLLLAHAAEETNDADDTLGLDGLEALGHGFGAADFEDVVDTEAVRGGRFGGGAPVGVVFVVDDGVGAEFAEGVGFGGGAGGGDDAGASGFGELRIV